MMRRLRARLEASRAGMLYRRLDGTSEVDGMPWMIGPPEAVAEHAPEARDGAVAQPVVERDFAPVAREFTAAGANETRLRLVTDGSPAHEDPGLVPALNRVAGAFERMAASMEIEHREREARLDAVENLLRELVTGLAQPTAVPPVVLGGSIDLTEPELTEPEPTEPRLELDTSDDPPDDLAKKPGPARRTRRASQP